MKVIITQNREKDLGVVNGQNATVITVQNETVFWKLPNGKIVAVYPVTLMTENGNVTTYPLVPAYASTICKIQGQNLKKIILWLDSSKLPQGSAYVALSRIKFLKDLFFLQPTYASQYNPVEQLQC
jgi:ATP-dependent exoDNAse (exonuclease V) alpha subunit